MNEYEQKEETTPISKINSAFLINLRIDAILKDAHRHSRDGLYSKWNDDLDRLWLEVGADTKAPVPSEEDKKQLKYSIEEAEYRSLSVKYGEACGKVKKERVGFETATPDDKDVLVKQKLALMDKELFLRRLINKQGKGTAYQDNSSDYMDN